jgi:hypothetical protein
MSAATSTILAGVGIAAGAGESLMGHGSSSAPKDPFGDKIKQAQLDLSNKSSSAGFGDLSTARKTFQLPINYWSKILTGGRYDALEALAPEVNTITSQYDAGTRAMSEFSPRSGGRTSAMEENRFRKNADITKTLLGARPAAAQGLLSAASGVGALGSGELSSASSALSGASSTNASQQQLALERQRMANENASGIGSGLGSIFASLLSNRTGSTNPNLSGAATDPGFFSSGGGR